MKNNENGSTLVSTLIAVGLSGVIAVVLMQQQETSGKIQSKNNVNQIINSASNTIQQSLNNRASCSLSLAGKSVGSSVGSLVAGEVDPNNYNNFISGAEIFKVGDPLEGPTAIGGPQIDNMVIITENGQDYLEVTFNADPKSRRNLGVAITKKRYSIQGTKIAGVYSNCSSESSNLVETAAEQACESLGGALDGNKKCQLPVADLIDSTPVVCNVGSKMYPTIINGKIAMACSPCTHIKIWDHYQCEKWVAGKQWVNCCFYKTVCSEDRSTIIIPAAWDGLTGPTNASGGDTGTRGNCHDRRKRCAGEPP
jgi:hypothetical protein